MTAKSGNRRPDQRHPRGRTEQGRSLVGREYEVEVGSVAHGGHCIARHDGRVLFVRHALPGERVVARVTDGGEKSKFLRADAVRVMRASDDRVTDGCPAAGPGKCGGCDWQHTTSAAQRALKADVVREQLQRIGGMEWEGEVEAMPTHEERGWRTRVEFAVTGSGSVGLRAHRSHDVIPLTDCRIADPGIIATGMLEDRVPAEVTGLDTVVDSSGEVLVIDLPEDDEPLPAVVQEVLHRSFEVDARGFWQVHPDAAATFVRVVLEMLDPQPGDRALDLFSGVGLFTAFLAEQVGEDGAVVGIEGDEVATHYAFANLADLPQASAICSDVAAALAPTDAFPDADLVVLDPPRTGAGRAVVEAVVARSPRAVAYVACDPAALARDLKYFTERGYRVCSVRAFDAFPMTHHVECIALLEPTVGPASTD
ncbi:class I SAM-dependent RNA methyltransferase [Calidifontibacter terrae]